MKKNKDFLVGFAMALTTLASTHNSPSLAKDIATSNGLAAADFKGIGLTEFDRRHMRKIFK